jgi:hypothetical protein
MKKNKKWIVVLIVLFPSLLWIILETSTINSRKLPHYGPKQLAETKDTLFYSVQPAFKSSNGKMTDLLYDTLNYPIMAIMFIKETYRNDAYRISGFWEYVNYKKDKIEHIPFVLVTELSNALSATEKELYKMTEYSDNIHFCGWNKSSYDSLNKVYFAEKPYYVDFSFMILLDKKRHIRGYYDSRYVSEVKRLLDEYRHLRLKEEKQQLIKDNEIKTK